MGVLSLRFNKGLGTKVRGLMGTSLIGYGLGGIFVAPEIYNSLMTEKSI